MKGRILPFSAAVVLLLSGLAAQLAGCHGSTAPGTAGAGQTDRPPVAVRWAADPSRASEAWVEITGLPPFLLDSLNRSATDLGWQSVLAVYAGGGPDDGMPPMLGDYRVERGVVRFIPRFPLEAGVTYRAVFWSHVLLHRSSTPSTVPVAVVADYQAPAAQAGARTVVSHVYPTADTVPENLLKFYVHFSSPMSRGGIYDHVRLLDGAGNVIELPFLELAEELWDPSMTRLTLFIDPGRIKRGVRPLEEVGPSLEQGKAFTLVIAATARDAAGNALANDHRKSFRVGPPDRDPPEPAKWTLFPPPNAATREPLSVDFGKPMDHALAERVLDVTDATGRALEGAVTLDDAERRWRFVPASPWAAGRYEVVVQRTLEDLAGNNIGKPFEVDVNQGPRSPADTSAVRLPFTVP